MFKPSLFIAPIIGATALLLSVGLLADELSDLTSQVAALNQKLFAARAKFRADRLPTLAKYNEAKKQADDCAAKVEATRDRQGPEFNEALKNKVAADTNLRTVVADLEANDMEIAGINAKITPILAQIAAIQKGERDEYMERLREQQKIFAAKKQYYLDVINRDYKEKQKELSSIPLVGDETALSEPKASPQKFLDQPFIICGMVSISDYYNYGYEDLKPSHLAFRLQAVTADKKLAGDATIYIGRQKGDELSTVVAKREKYWPDAPWIMRVKIVLDSRHVKTFEDAQDLYTLLDWQFLGKDGWTCWHSEMTEDKDPRLTVPPGKTPQNVAPALRTKK